jgi:galactose mutarotase-like enzyme
VNTTIQNNFISVKVKSKGAELFSIITGQTGLEYMWSADPAYWPKTSPILFPIVGELQEQTFNFEGKKYSLPRHGFARDMDFEVEESTDDKIVYLLKSSDATLSKYPFPFELRIIYTLQDDRLIVTYEVANIGKNEMYFSIGGHPAFKVPLVGDTSYEDYYLEFNTVENSGRWPVTKEGYIGTSPEPLLTNTNKLPLKKQLFYQDAIVLKDLKSDQISIRSDKHPHGIDFSFPGFPFFGIWAFKDADFVCLEPWCGIADSVNHTQNLKEKEGIQKLESQKKWTRQWSVRCF